MRNYLKEFIENIAQRLIIRATVRATEMMDDYDREPPPKALPAPKMPEIGLN